MRSAPWKWKSGYTQCRPIESRKDRIYNVSMTEEASSLYGCETHSHETNREAEQRVKKKWDDDDRRRTNRWYN